MTLSDPNPDFKVTGYLKVEYLADGARVLNCTKHSCRPLGARRKPCKKWGRRWNFFAKSARKCFTPVIEIKPNNFSPQLNFYTDIQFIRGTFWLQLWMLKIFSEPRVSLNDGSKEVDNGKSWTYFAARTSSCRVGVCRACVMCRNLLGYSPCTDLVLIAC